MLRWLEPATGCVLVGYVLSTAADVVMVVCRAAGGRRSLPDVDVDGGGKMGLGRGKQGVVGWWGWARHGGWRRMVWSREDGDPDIGWGEGGVDVGLGLVGRVMVEGLGVALLHSTLPNGKFSL